MRGLQVRFLLEVRMHDVGLVGRALVCKTSGSGFDSHLRLGEVPEAGLSGTPAKGVRVTPP